MTKLLSTGPPGLLNMIRRGQGISDRFDGEAGTMMPVAAGEMSLHHTDLVHASGANDSLQDAGFSRPANAGAVA